MTKEITKARIIQEIQDKFKLREMEPEIFSFSERVIPTYDIEQHLEKWISKYKELSVTSATFYSFFHVPDNERWKIRRYDIVFMTAPGAYTVSGAYVSRGVGNNVYLDLKAGQSVSYHVDLIEPIVMQAGDYFMVLVDGYTSTAALRVYIDYVMEEIR